MATALTEPRTAFVDPDPCPPDDPEAAAREAGLRYVTDTEPGLRRMIVRGSVRYLDAKGTPITDERTLARISNLVIPPAWTDVWICARPNGHLQATGRDARGRKQYRYHSRWREIRDETKYGRLVDFGRCLPGIRARVADDLRLRGLPREKVLATVVELLEKTLIRVGNEEYARTNASYGLTTLRDDHVDLGSSKLTFVFKGKSGKEHEIGVRDRRLARIVRQTRDLPGQTLFQYVDESGEPHPIGSADVNAYLRTITGQPFTAKDFRTWFGSVLATETLLDFAQDPARAPRQLVPAAIKAVAEQLGNTVAVCRNCYVHPAVLEAHESGRLRDLAESLPLDVDGCYRPSERLLLAVLAS